VEDEEDQRTKERTCFPERIDFRKLRQRPLKGGGEEIKKGENTIQMIIVAEDRKGTTYSDSKNTAANVS